MKILPLSLFFFMIILYKCHCEHTSKVKNTTSIKYSQSSIRRRTSVSKKQIIKEFDGIKWGKNKTVNVFQHWLEEFKELFNELSKNCTFKQNILKNSNNTTLKGERTSSSNGSKRDHGGNIFVVANSQHENKIIIVYIPERNIILLPFLNEKSNNTTLRMNGELPQNNTLKRNKRDETSTVKLHHRKVVKNIDFVKLHWDDFFNVFNWYLEQLLGVTRSFNLDPFNKRDAYLFGKFISHYVIKNMPDVLGDYKQLED